MDTKVVDMDAYRERNPQENQAHIYQEDGPGRRSSRKKYVRTSPPYGALLLLAILVLLALLTVVGMDVFMVKEITVTGNDTVSTQDVIALSGIGIGENIFKVDLKLGAQRIQQGDPLLQVLDIHRVYPNTISITVKQRSPHAVCVSLSSFILLNEEGVVLDVRDAMPAGDYPLITGVNLKSYEKGKVVELDDAEDLRVLCELLKAIVDGGAKGYVAEINMQNREGIQMLSREGILIEMGKPADLPEKIAWIVATIPKLREAGTTSGVLYVTTLDGAVFSPTSPAKSGESPQTGGDGQTGDTEPSE